MTERNQVSTAPLTTKHRFKQKAKQELVDFAWIAAYLAFFFCALATYTMLLLKKYDISDSSLNYTFALINAMIIAKVILIGEMVHLGQGAEARPLYQAALYKAIVYSLLVLAFHFLEEFIRRLIHGEPAGTVWHNVRFEQLIARSIVIFCAFMPLFAFRELRRVLGEETLSALFLKPRVKTAKGPLPQDEGAR
jgi:hypothetical protein